MSNFWSVFDNFGDKYGLDINCNFNSSKGIHCAIPYIFNQYASKSFKGSDLNVSLRKIKKNHKNSSHFRETFNSLISQNLL